MPEEIACVADLVGQRVNEGLLIDQDVVGTWDVTACAVLGNVEHVDGR